MPVPIINATQSILGYLQGQTWSYQPAASNTPTGWNSSPLPAGLSLNGTTGLVSGAVTSPGVFLLTLFATNATGTSAGVTFTVAIEASAIDPTSIAIELTLDIATGEVSWGGAGPAFVGKFSDDLIFRLYTTKSGVRISPTISALKLGLKELEEDPELVESSAFHAEGSGVFTLYLSLAGDALKGALSNYAPTSAQEQASTASSGAPVADALFGALCEIEWTATNPYTGSGVGPATVTRRSQTFKAAIAKGLIA